MFDKWKADSSGEGSIDLFPWSARPISQAGGPLLLIEFRDCTMEQVNLLLNLYIRAENILKA